MSTHAYCLIAALLLSACASTHPGKIGKSMAAQAKLPLKISAQNIEGEKNDSLQLIEITLENTSEDWLKFDKTQLMSAASDKMKTSVVLGNDLKAWAQASALKQKVDEHNKEMLQWGLLGVGTVATIAGGGQSNPGLATAGAAVVVGTYAWAVTDAINDSLNDAQRSEKIPENHLYHSASIAPKMYLRRWILLNKPVGQSIKNVVIEFETVEGEKETYALDI